jgi:phosphoribosylformylglycinamidine synthase
LLVYIEKKPGFNIEASALKNDLEAFLGAGYPALARLANLRILNKYQIEGLDEAQFDKALAMVLSEAQGDRASAQIEGLSDRSAVFAVEYLPGQYDQRADSAAQCIELAVGIKPLVRTARVYIIEGNDKIDDAALAAVKKYLINPVDSREEVDIYSGLVMGQEDIEFTKQYFASEGREPTLAELKVLDTYWSDHCRHTTFNTELEISSRGDAGARRGLELYQAVREEVYGSKTSDRPITLMDMATIGAKVLKKRGLLNDLDDSPEINACTIKIEAEFCDGDEAKPVKEPWLLLFKNETHNHPTEIEPFGGAATCLGGAIRDPLSGRAFVHQAMRITGAGNPLQTGHETLPNKLPQIKICREAAQGYSSYGNQIGLATGQVEEFYHPGFAAKRMELGAVIAAVPVNHVRREEPSPGDLVILVGGKTGRDGIGGATGSSKAHTDTSVGTSGAEVQKGNAVEERKLQRLFRNKEASLLIKRCNDFGAGGVAVAVGELAPGLDINLDAVPKKYEGLNGIELAISESQERMAVVVEAKDAEAFIALAAAENLDATIIAKVTDNKRLRMHWKGEAIVDLSREFLDTNGAKRKAVVKLLTANDITHVCVDHANKKTVGVVNAYMRNVVRGLLSELQSLRSCSRRGLKERFDGSIGAASVLFPFGGATQGTPECGAAALLPSLPNRQCTTASLMTFGYNPELAELDPHAAAKGAVREALAKIACLGGNWQQARLSLQEYFPRAQSPESWGKVASALLGALEAQVELGIPAIGGKDSMSGSYSDAANGINIEVPPTLVAFAATVAPAKNIRSGTLSGEAGNELILLQQSEENEWESFKQNMAILQDLGEKGLVKAAYPVGPGGVEATLAVMAFGNMVGVEVSRKEEVGSRKCGQGSVIVEICGGIACDALVKNACIIGKTIDTPIFKIGDEEIGLQELRDAYEGTLEAVYPVLNSHERREPVSNAVNTAFVGAGVRAGLKPAPTAVLRTAVPTVILPVFPGTNCEYDMERAFLEAGAEVQQLVFCNRSREDIAASTAALAKAISQGQILALSGGFSAGDEPDGSGKFIANVLRSPAIQDALMELIETRKGLVLGICNGFQALIKLGLVPYGKFTQPREDAPTLTTNTIGRHVSRMVRTEILPNNSPWMALDKPGTEYSIPVSHGEGRIVISPTEAADLFARGQVPCVYAPNDNPNGSAYNIEALSSPNGRVLGKMGHSERRGPYVHRNIPGNKTMQLFRAGVQYF